MANKAASTYVYDGGSSIPPDAPATLTQSDSTTASVTLGWAIATVPTGGPPVQGYNVYQDGVFIQRVGALVTSTTITGLTTGPNFQVAAFNADGEGAKSPVLTAVLQSPEAPGAPGNFQFTVVGAADTATVTWDAATAPDADPVQGYRIRKIGSTTVIASTTTALTANLTGLAAGDQVQVKAYNNVGQGRGSTILTFQPGTSTSNTYTPLPSGLVHDSYSIACLLNNRNTLYGDDEATSTALGDLGVKHIRSRFSSNLPAVMNQMRHLSETWGITAISRFGAFEEPVTGTGRQATPAELVADMVTEFGPTTALPDRKVTDYVHSIEGFNEPNNNGVPWIAKTLQYQKDMYDAVNAEAQTASIPVMGPPLARVIGGATGAEGGADGVSAGTLAGQVENLAKAAEAMHGETGKGLDPYVDWGTMHVYPLGSSPSTDYDTFAIPLRQHLYKAPMPLACTEGGYFTDTAYTGGSQVTPEHVAAIYHDRHIMEHVIRGTPVFNEHELWDDALPANPDNTKRRESSFGLLRADKTKKPGYFTIKRFLGLLADDDTNKRPKRSIATTAINVAVNPTPGPPGSTTQRLRMAVAQKSDGKVLLIVWRDVNVTWSRTGPDYAITPLTALNVTFTLQSAKNWTVYMPSKQAQSVAASTSASTSYTVPISDHLAVIVLS